MIRHATLVALWRAPRWRGVLIEGPSGAGKSTLALRLIAAGARLVADDRVRVWVSGERAYGCAPAALRGLLEVRGVGVLTQPALPFAAIDLLLVHSAQPERVPETQTRDVAGRPVRAVALDLLDPTTPFRLRLVLDSDAASHGFALREEGRITSASPAGPSGF